MRVIPVRVKVYGMCQFRGTMETASYSEPEESFLFQFPSVVLLSKVIDYLLLVHNKITYYFIFKGNILF